MLYAEIAQKSELDAELIAGSFEIYENLEAAKHLFTVASGLESAVVGEREIAGQVRRALAYAQEEGTFPGSLYSFSSMRHTPPVRLGSTPLSGHRGVPSYRSPWIWRMRSPRKTGKLAVLSSLERVPTRVLLLQPCVNADAKTFGLIPVRAAPRSLPQKRDVRAVPKR